MTMPLTLPWRALPGTAALVLAFAALTGCGADVASSQAKAGSEPPPAASSPAPSPSPAAAVPPSDAPAATLRAEARAPETPARSPEVARPVPVAGAGAGESYPSSLYVERDVKIAARTSGVIRKVLVDRGASVKAGQPLASLETDVPAREVEVAEQELRLAQADYDRIHPLIDSKVVSPQEYQHAEAAKDVAASQLALAKARLDQYIVYAPFDGVVVERWAVAGQRVQVDDDTPLFRVASREALRARIDVPEDRALKIVPGGRARIDVTGAESLEARVVFVGPARDAASGTVPVIVELSRPSSAAVLGAAAMVHLEGSGGGRASGKGSDRARTAP